MSAARVSRLRPSLFIGISAASAATAAALTIDYRSLKCDLFAGLSKPKVLAIEFKPEGTRCNECDGFMDMYGYDKCIGTCDKCRAKEGWSQVSQRT